MTGHSKWSEVKEIRRGMDLRLAVAGDHFVQCEIGGGYVNPDTGRADPAWVCRDCGERFSFDESRREAWRAWVMWCISAPLEIVEAAQERSHCGGV